MYQFFVDPGQIQGTRITITGKDVNHIKNVLRMKKGEEISVSNGLDGKEYRCGIEELLEDEVICTLRFVKEEGLELPSRVFLFQGLPKADKMELIIQKAVELGVYQVKRKEQAYKMAGDCRGGCQAEQERHYSGSEECDDYEGSYLLQQVLSGQNNSL